VLETRAQELELLDQPSLDDLSAGESYRFMSKVNRYFGGTAAVRKFIQKYAKSGQVTRILDIGSGGCDIPAAVSDLLESGDQKLEFTCIESNPFAVRMARERLDAEKRTNIKLVDVDIFGYQPQEDYDFAIGSMFFHHLSKERIIDLLDRLKRFVSKGIFINDLHRSAINYAGCMAATAFSSEVVRHDALLSIRKGFTREELELLLRQAGYGRFEIEQRWFCRITATIIFDAGRNL
jgi:SAM-dependent methyltransferase